MSPSIFIVSCQVLCDILNLVSFCVVTSHNRNILLNLLSE